MQPNITLNLSNYVILLSNQIVLYLQYLKTYSVCLILGAAINAFIDKNNIPIFQITDVINIANKGCVVAGEQKQGGIKVSNKVNILRNGKIHTIFIAMPFYCSYSIKNSDYVYERAD